MNKVELVGRLTKDPEVKLTSNQTQFCNFTIAVDRRFKDQNGQRQADYGARRQSLSRSISIKATASVW